MASPTWDLQWRDTFLDYAHLKECFSDKKITLDKSRIEKANKKVNEKEGQTREPCPPYRIEFLDQKKRMDAMEAGNKGKFGPVVDLNLKVTPYHLPVPGPYPEDQPKRNSIRFTQRQVEAIRSGLNHGLTMIVGPPGTGKTDVAVQIMAELYQNFPNQRTLLVTHSNHALNDLFEKIMARDIDERYLLRCGRGEEELKTEKDFSKFGRVNYMLERRIHCLDEVSRLAKSLGLADDAAYTCENAAHFYLQHVLARWEVFLAQWDRYQEDGTMPPEPIIASTPVNPTLTAASAAMEEVEEEEEEEEEGKTEAAAAQAAAAAAAAAAKIPKGFVAKFFPFTAFFCTAPHAVFDGTGADETGDLERARGCWKHLEGIFTELKECRPFEILRNYRDRGDFLLTKHAKVIAMTCTHAAIRRGEFVNLGFQYDNLIMEESAQILEIETFIPMLLQEHDKEFGCRLKRVVMLGDHHQLPPVVKNMAFQKYSHMDQSLFTRFIRLGTPHIQLNAQGRSRPSIAKLWNWRYQSDTKKAKGKEVSFGDLPHVSEQEMYLTANAGFTYEYQFIDVGDMAGKGCTSPVPFFYQNVAEAEYVVQTYMYMRLLGYPASTISILTTYNGQKSLLEDIVQQRCANHPLFGPPARISTVDKYQGQQNDYILLSLVRTVTPGHIRDVRRLVVAMSRARLGLYVFGREALFKNCFELAPTFNQLFARPTKLHLNVQELSSLTKRSLTELEKAFEVTDLAHMGQVVAEMAQRAAQNLGWGHEQQKAGADAEKARARAELMRLAAEKKAAFEKAEAEANAEAAAQEGGDETEMKVGDIENDAMETEEGSEEDEVAMKAAAAQAKAKQEAAKKAATKNAAAKAMAAEKAAAEEAAKKAAAEKKTAEMVAAKAAAADADDAAAQKSVAEESEKKKDNAKKLPAVDFSKMSYKQLQAACKEAGLKASGKKAALLSRLQTEGQ